MTVSFEEFEAEGLTRKEMLEYWEWDNKSWQPHKFRGHLHLTPTMLEQWWPLKDVHGFCMKICAIYATVNMYFERELAEYLWTKWFRPGETPCRFGNFFARYVGSYKSECPKTVADLLDAHRRVCAQVLLRQITLAAHDDKPKPSTIDERANNNPYEDHENYSLEATFHSIFLVMDTLPPRKRHSADQDFLAATPVLLVRTGEYHDLRTGPVDFAPIQAVSEEIDGNANIRRIALGDAVDFLLELHRQNCVERSIYEQ
ncbi:MAG: hypothetical protein Q9213_002209 [Squamulea squamosa]